MHFDQLVNIYFHIILMCIFLSSSIFTNIFLHVETYFLAFPLLYGVHVWLKVYMLVICMYARRIKEITDRLDSRTSGNDY